MGSRMEPPIGEKLVEILPRLRQYARSLVFSEADADDLVQKTCVRALERQAQFQPGTSLIAWAITIMKNIQKDMWKRPIRLVQADPEEIPEIPDTHSQRSIESKLELNDVHRAMHKLPIEFREVLVLKAGGFSYAEISQDLGIPKGTVMSRLNRGREKLARLLDE